MALTAQPDLLGRPGCLILRLLEAQLQHDRISIASRAEHMHMRISKVSVLSAAASEAALAQLADAAELPTFLGGSKPEAECFVSRAERVPEGVSEQLSASLARR